MGKLFITHNGIEITDNMINAVKRMWRNGYASDWADSDLIVEIYEQLTKEVFPDLFWFNCPDEYIIKAKEIREYIIKEHILKENI